MTNSIENNKGEIILYQPDETIRLEVRLEDETVWLTQAQIVVLFQKAKSTISFHISNIFKEGELDERVVVRKNRTTTLHGAIEGKKQTHEVAYYNLDVIISVGYRVKSLRGTKFRQWATGIIREHLLKGFTINHRLDALESKMEKVMSIQNATISQIQSTLSEHQQKLNFFVQTSLPPVVGVFSNGQVFSARLFVEDLIKTAQHEVVLIDNYVDAKTFDMLDVRNVGVQAAIYTEHIDASLQRLQQLHNQEHPSATVTVQTFTRPFHDRFLIIDDELWHCGASFKDLGRKLFAIDKLQIDKNIILNQL
ncbi:MAG: virulence RhuM family protein [Prevotella sp.]|nr:virulence RhuM family protein [Prevotella sp.]